MTRLGLSLFSAASLLALAGSIAILRGEQREARASDPSPPPAAAAARLFFAHGDVDGFESEIAWADVTTPAAQRAKAAIHPVAKLAHPKGAALRGAVRGDVVFVVADADAPHGTAYDAALFRVEAGKSTRLVADVAHAATPVVTESGRVLVARGVDGAEPTPDQAKQLKLRVDELSIDDVDPSTGSARAVWRGKGQLAFLAAAVPSADAAKLGGDVVVYHVTDAGASLFALDSTTGATRALAKVAPFARDFSWDHVHGALTFVDLAADRATYEGHALDAAGVTRVLFRTPNEHAMPFALPSGDLALSSDGDHGLAILAATPGTHPRLLSPLGDGSDAVTHASSDGRWVALRHTSSLTAGPPQVVAFDPSSGKSVAPDVPAGHFVEPFGFSSTTGGAP